MAKKSLKIVSYALLGLIVLILLLMFVRNLVYEYITLPAMMN